MVKDRSKLVVRESGCKYCIIQAIANSCYTAIKSSLGEAYQFCYRILQANELNIIHIDFIFFSASIDQTEALLHPHWGGVYLHANNLRSYSRYLSSKQNGQWISQVRHKLRSGRGSVATIVLLGGHRYFLSFTGFSDLHYRYHDSDNDCTSRERTEEYGGE